jgi:hypothetical protein
MYIYIYSVENFIIVILMYPVLNLTHILNILDKFSMGVTPKVDSGLTATVAALEGIIN